MKKLINKFDFEALDTKMEKSKVSVDVSQNNDCCQSCQLRQCGQCGSMFTVVHYV